MARIAIIGLTRALKPNFIVHCLAEVWRDAGHRVDVGSTCASGTDAAILHINLTRIRPGIITRLPPDARLINGTVLDISKRRISALMLGPEDAWDGPVIVKTDLNAFGMPESKGRTQSWAGRMRKRASMVSWQLARRLPPVTYPVLPHLRRVPGWVWRDRSLIVERFMPERDGDHYCLRGWVFFGSRSYGYRLFANDPMVKIASMVRHEYLDEVPPELLALREKLGFDFGKFDYVVHEGRAIVLDTNRTPTMTGDRRSPRLMSLAEGIGDFLP